MDLANWVSTNWALIKAAPGAIISLCVIMLGAGFFGALFFFKHRNELLKEQVDYWKDRAQPVPPSASPAAAPAEPTYRFPPAGFHGTNLLSSSIIDMSVGQAYSMAAVIPDGKRLRVRLVGPRARYLEDNGGAWTFSIGTRNWAHNLYDPQADEQTFEAGPGEADLQFFPRRPGRIGGELTDETGRLLRQFTVKVRDEGK